MVDTPAGTEPRMDQEATAEAPYGFRSVPLVAKQAMVDSVFDRVAERYDIMNDLMSGGMHRVWKDAFVTAVNPPKTGRIRWNTLDVAGGTGDIATQIVRRSRDHVHATVLDINGEMLSVGKRRAEKAGLARDIDFVRGNAECLPLPDRSFEAYTIAFGIRNVPRRALALKEAYRVLKPGCRFLCLEFSTVDVPGLDRIYDFFSFHLIPRIGHLVAGDAEPYRYLVESIRTFPNAERFAEEIRDAGFQQVKYTLLSGGIAAIHSGVRI